MPNLGGGGSSSITSTNIVDDEIIDADINSAAGIAYSKLNLANSIKDTDIDTNYSLPKVKTVNVSSAEILALAATPKELIAAPGAGKVILVDQIVYSFTPGGTQYANGASINPIYAGGTTNILGNAAGNSLAATIVNGVASYVRAVIGDGSTPEAQVNTAVQLKNSGAEFITGNGTIKIYIKYRILTL